MAAVVAALAAPAFGQQPAATQSLPSKAEAIPILEKAGEQMRLAEPGHPPFHLLAKLLYTLDGKSSDGTYEVLWASPDRFRDEFRLGPIGETDIALGDKLYILRNSPASTYHEFRVRGLMGLPENNGTIQPFKIAKVYADGADDKVVCFGFPEPSKGLTECVDQATGQLVSVNVQSKEGRTNTTSLLPERFMSFGAVNYPWHILSTLAKETFEISVEKLDPVASFAAQTFIPPAGASSRDWCPKPEVPKEMDSRLATRLFLGDYAPSPRPEGFRGYYFLIAPDGRIEKDADMYSDGTTKKAAAQLSLERFPVHLCGGKPIEYETVFMTVALR